MVISHLLRWPQIMVDSQCHSFEDVSSGGNYPMSIRSQSHSDSTHGSGSVRRVRLHSINKPLSSSANSSHELLSLPKPKSHDGIPSLQENRAAFTAYPERGRSRSRKPLSKDPVRNKYHSPIFPDRFIPKRDFGDSPSTPYRVNKHPQELSPRERLLRQRLPADDPFLPTPPRTPAFPGQNTKPTRLRQRPLQRFRLVTNPAVVGGNRPNDFLRQVSSGAVWGVGGASAILGESSAATTTGSQNFSRNSTAPTFVAKFLPKNTKADEQNKHESRIALALDIDPTTRLLDTCRAYMEIRPHPLLIDHERFQPFIWKDSAWKKGEREHWPTVASRREIVPPKPFRILDAPYMRDDFYCSTLAYSFTSGVLAVGLAQSVYLWSEGYIVDRPPFGDVHPSNYVTSLSFSSENGGRSILAVGRQSGQLSLWSVHESKVRFEISHPNSISCVSFKPRTSQRPSEGFANIDVDVEVLAAGDEMGNIWYYSIEWPELHNEWSWTGSMTLLAKISAHTQQVCGLAWSPDDQFLASGGNDNACMLFELHDILPSQSPGHPSLPTASSDLSPHSTVRTLPALTSGSSARCIISRRQIVSHLLPSWVHSTPLEAPAVAPLLSRTGCLISDSEKTSFIPSIRRKHRLAHAAAVKAIAFAPWQPSLLATGGGSNDRAIHFFHTRTGVCLATINVFAQVTSLIWSQTRREIAATFGYAQPEHPFRIAIFAWPSCAQIAVIPWGPYGASWDGQDQDINYDCGRALWAVSYPGRPPCPLSVNLDDPDIPCERDSPPSPVSGSQTAERGNNSGGRREGPRAIRPKEKEGGMWCTRTMDKGCIIVASSDQTVKFHEVWTGRRKSTGSACGLLGGSDILEGMEGIEKSGSEVIR